MSLSTCPLLIVLSLCPLSGSDKSSKSEPVTLRWRFEKGKTFYQEMTTKTRQEMTVMQMKIAQNQEQTFVFSLTPLEKKGRNWIVRLRIEELKMVIEIGGNKIEYCSYKDDGNNKNPLTDFFKTLKGAEFKLIIGPDFRIVDVEGLDKLVADLTKNSPQMESILKSILTKESLKQMSDPAFAGVPAKPVKRGDRWTLETKLEMGPIGTYKTEHKYTYKGRDKNLERIDVETKLTYQAPDPKAGGGLPFKIKKADLKSKSASGVLYFDAKKGRLDHSEMKLDLEGKLTIEIGGMETEVDLSQQQETTVRVLDKKPEK